MEPKCLRNVSLELSGKLMTAGLDQSGRQGRSEIAAVRLLELSQRLLGPSWGARSKGLLLRPSLLPLGLLGSSWGSPLFSWVFLWCSWGHRGGILGTS